MAKDVNAKKILLRSKDGLLHTSCLLVSCLVTEWPPVACKLYPSGRQSHTNCTQVATSRMQISDDFILVACDWRPRGYNFHATGGLSGTIYVYATGGYSGTIYMRLAASFLQARCENNYLNEKMKTPLKTLCMARSNLVRQFL